MSSFDDHPVKPPNRVRLVVTMCLIFGFAVPLSMTIADYCLTRPTKPPVDFALETAYQAGLSKGFDLGVSEVIDHSDTITNGHFTLRLEDKIDVLFTNHYQAIWPK